ncbi:MAG: family peptidase [Hydrocarboniphaga sp.]|uniref:M48 family metalloprotease n=1 Tax=Hydrocarboniphaga sp. TaxID=2033016 RepID=UPI0026044683|nr:M48 family metalloprotease [Hydrocarboniphaga sp.]MDB5969031.1 family peptidase [Hydrocarboniphaga sp.]
MTSFRLSGCSALSLRGGLAAATALLMVTSALAADALEREPINSVGRGAPSELNLPQMGEPADAAMSPSQEAAIGASVMAELYQYDYVVDDLEISEYLSNLGYRLVAAAPQKPPKVDVFMVADPRINAFALPGGHMGFNAGLLIASRNESELAGVMGHELTHVIQRHVARSQDDQGGVGTFATWAAVLAAIIAGSADPNVVLAALAIGQGSLYQKQVNFTRANELEADRIGIQIMADAGFDPEGMADFFQRLEQQSRLYGTGLPEILQTHPVNTTRIAEARERAAVIEAGKPRKVVDSLDYSLMKARTRVLATDSQSEAIEIFSAEMKAGHDTPDNRYGLAFALSGAGNYKDAISALKPTLEAYPRQATVMLLMAQLKLGAGQNADAISLFEKTYRMYPSYAPAILRYSQALIETGKPDEARQILLASEQAYGTRLETYRLLSQAARDAGNNGEASYEMANYLYYRGDYGGALAQLDAGLRIESLPQPQRARMAARRAEVREALPRNFNPYAKPQRR